MKPMLEANGTKADPTRFRDPSTPPHRFWAIHETDRFWGHFAHRTRSALGLGLLLSLRFMSGVICSYDLDGLSPIRLAPHPAANPPKMLLGSRNPLELAQALESII